jgi:hypothetical protein
MSRKFDGMPEIKFQFTNEQQKGHRYLKFLILNGETKQQLFVFFSKLKCGVLFDKRHLGLAKWTTCLLLFLLWNFEMSK